MICNLFEPIVDRKTGGKVEIRAVRNGGNSKALLAVTDCEGLKTQRFDRNSPAGSSWISRRNAQPGGGRVQRVYWQDRSGILHGGHRLGRGHRGRERHPDPDLAAFIAAVEAVKDRDAIYHAPARFPQRVARAIPILLD
jgi:hypothetical protein